MTFTTVLFKEFLSYKTIEWMKNYLSVNSNLASDQKAIRQLRDDMKRNIKEYLADNPMNLSPRLESQLRVLNFFCRYLGEEEYILE